MMGSAVTCVCGLCVKCRARKRKRQQRRINAPDWRLMPAHWRWAYFRRIALDLFGPDANLQSTLRTIDQPL